MKTLENHVIIYDDECPLCSVYTHAFVKTGMLDQQGRQSYTDILRECPSGLDINRARNEIALVNKMDLTITYGIDSLLMILGHNMPWIKEIFRIKPFRYLLDRLYFFISFNRKVIAPGSVFEGQNRCTPDFSLKYRWAYIIFAWLITSSILVRYSALVVPIVPSGGYLREFIVCAGQLVFQAVFIAPVRRDRLIHYFGNVMTISLCGALFLALIFPFTELITSQWFFILYFMLVVSGMFFVHIRRVKTLELPWYISATWIAYRFIVLAIILFI